MIADRALKMVPNDFLKYIIYIELIKFAVHYEHSGVFPEAYFNQSFS